MLRKRGGLVLLRHEEGTLIHFGEKGKISQRSSCMVRNSRSVSAAEVSGCRMWGRGPQGEILGL